MTHKRYLKRLIFELRRKGLSYGQLASKFNFSKGTLSGWFGGLAWSNKITTKLNRVSGKHFQKNLKKSIKVQKEAYLVRKGKICGMLLL